MGDFCLLPASFTVHAAGLHGLGVLTNLILYSVSFGCCSSGAACVVVCEYAR